MRVGPENWSKGVSPLDGYVMNDFAPSWASASTFHPCIRDIFLIIIELKSEVGNKLCGPPSIPRVSTPGVECNADEGHVLVQWKVGVPTRGNMNVSHWSLARKLDSAPGQLCDSVPFPLVRFAVEIQFWDTCIDSKPLVALWTR